MDPGAPIGAAKMQERDGPPLVAILALALDGVERRHLGLMAEAGFDDVRKAHNAVFAHLPDSGLRLTDLAEAAGISKQAMAELIGDLEAKGYVEKVSDPTDGRAKLIVWAERGLEAHELSMAVFARIDDELSDVLTARGLVELKRQLDAAVAGLWRID